MSKCFDVPFNFDESFIYAIENIRFQKYKVNSFYIHPFAEDYTETNLTAVTTMPTTREEYENWLIKYFKANVNLNLFKMQLILENANTVMNKETLEYYLNFGFSQFSCSNIEQAQVIKEIYPEAEIIGSIFMDISPEKLKLHPEYKDYFNKFVLPFSYNRKIKEIEKLPKDYEYIIIPNANVFLQVDSDIDLRDNLINTQDVPRISDLENFKNLSKIRPIDLKLFYNKNISHFRLWNPNWPTTIILQDLLVYSYPYENYADLSYDENLYNILSKDEEGII